MSFLAKSSSEGAKVGVIYSGQLYYILKMFPIIFVSFRRREGWDLKFQKLPSLCEVFRKLVGVGRRHVRQTLTFAPFEVKIGLHGRTSETKNAVHFGLIC